MNRLCISIHSVQHISSLTLEVDLTKHGLLCLVGRNGVGKTTLVRALRNLSNADTFLRTASPKIFSEHSRIVYNIDETEIVFKYEKSLGSLNCRHEIPSAIREAVSAELPIPHGARFNYSKNASLADGEIRKRIALNSFEKPNELINFLSSIYATDKYSALIEVPAKGQKYYAIAHADGTYIREDYLSSGEYFLINLYRTFKSATQLVVIDEIDLSLDAAAQAKLAEWLRSFCRTYRCTILFTTHSLAILRTLDGSEISYLENEESKVSITPVSYSYVKSRLFGFQGWDKYVLTEDLVLSGFIEFLLVHRCRRAFFSCKLIHVGGGSQVADLLLRNSVDEFLAKPNDVIAVLDGDERGKPYASKPSVHLIPLESVEKDLYARRLSDPNFPFHCARISFTSDKDFFRYLQQARIATVNDIYEYLVKSNAEALEPLIETLSGFLERPLGSTETP